MSVEYYHSLLADNARIGAFRDAIDAAVRPGETVLEIGTGLGTYAFFAARAGAGRVWAVDSQPIVHVAEAIATQNDLDARIEWVRGTVPEVTLPERVDLLVFEDFSTRLLDPGSFRMLRAAYKRHLKPDGRVLPEGAELFVAPVDGEALWPYLYPLRRDQRRAFGIDWGPSLTYVENTPRQVGLEPEHFAADPTLLTRVGLHPLPSPAELGGRASWTMDGAQTVRALAFWFELELVPGVRVSNRPGPDCGPWGQVLLPLPEPLTVGAGEVLEVEIASQTLADGAPGWLSWWARVGDSVQRGNEFASEPASLADMFGTAPPSEAPRIDASVPEESTCD